MGMLRLPSPFSCPSVSIGLGYRLRYQLFFASYKVPVFTLLNRTFLFMVSPYWPFLVRRSPALPCSHATPFCICFALRPRPNRPSSPWFMRWLGVVPGAPRPKTSMIDLSRLNNEAFTVTVYASCQYLYWLRKTRFRWMASPCRVGSVPTGLLKGVSYKF